MKNILATTIAFLVFVFIVKAEEKQIAVHHTDPAEVVFTNNINSAVTIANPGDTIYIPAGYYELTSSRVDITKELHIYGVGYADADITKNTRIIGTIYFKPGSSNSTLTGVYVNSTISIAGSASDTLNNIIITRCRSAYVSGSYYYVKNCILSELVVSTQISSFMGVNILNSIVNTIVSVADSYIMNNIIVYSCPQNYYSSSPIRSCHRNEFYNNILLTQYNPIYLSENNRFFNNLIRLSIPNGTNTGENNIYGYLPNFVSVSGGYWGTTCDLHLADGSPCIGTGYNGTDMGIYGGAKPFKESRLPVLPQIESGTVELSEDGKAININFNVNAQTK